MKSRPQAQTSTNTVRVTSGIYRGRELKVPADAHPMGSRERLALFNRLSPYLAGAKVLDAFAGSGALGIEALSRGAGTAVFLEKTPQASQAIKANLKALGLSAAVITAPVAKFSPTRQASSQVRSAPEKAPLPEQYDIILADPPYDDFHPESFQNLPALLAQNGVFALSYPDSFTPVIDGLKLISSQKYAKCNISLFTK